MTRIIAALGLCFIASCISSDVARVNATSYAPTSNVEVLFAEPQRAYRVIATIQVDGSPTSSAQRRMRRLIDEGAAVGADAVVVQGNSQLSHLGGMVSHHVHALAVKYQ